MPFVLTIIVPTPAIMAVDPAGYVWPPTVNPTTVFVSPLFASVSFVNTLSVTGVSSGVDFESFTATGTAFTGATKISNTAISVEVPSLTV